MGCPLPVRSRRSRVQPFRCSFLRPYPRILLLGRSSHGVRLSFTVCPAISALDLSAGSTSPGVFLPLQRSRRRESTSRSRLRPRAPWWCQGVRRRVPTRRLRCRSQVFSTSQQLVLPSALPPFQTGGAPGVLPSGIWSFREAPAARRRRHALVTFIVFRAFVFAKIGPALESRLVARGPTFPSWSFSSSWCEPSPTGRACARHPTTLHRHPVCCQT